MFLAIDVGNSRIKAGLYDDRTLVFSFEMEMDPSASVAAYRHSLRGRLKGRIPIAAGISSVVPEMTSRIVKAVRDDFMVVPTLIGAHSVTQFEIDYDPPESLGVDRLCAVAAAFERYGIGPEGNLRPLLVVDAGTAITFDLLVQGVHRGGSIMAGPSLISAALSGGTAQLGPIDLSRPRHPVENTTSGGLRSGIMFGVIDSVAGMLQRITLAEAVDPFVVVTGGAGKMLSEEIPDIDVFEPDLVLDGIVILAEGDSGQ